MDANIDCFNCDSANVLYQQCNWWPQVISKDDNGRLARLPEEIREKAIGEVGGFPISLITAKCQAVEGGVDGREKGSCAHS